MLADERYDPPAGGSLVMIALAVLALHLLFGVGIVLSPPLRESTDAVRPLVLLTELPSPITVVASGGFVADDPMISIPLPHAAVPVLPATPDTDGVIVDAAGADNAEVSRVCGTWPVQRSLHDEAQQDPSVLVRVEADGRVSDSRLLVGTGSADRDAALRHCLLTLARLTPIRLDGQIVPAWQRLKPLARSSRR
jgi:hypothetical protein